jgi:gamma-glutamyltranspeptidase/glutathione hydrolase
VKGIRARHRPAARAILGIVGTALALAVGLGHGAPATAQRASLEPEAASGRQAKALARAERHMVSSANPHASEAGREMLRRGGSAVDAAIAAALVLNLVEPQSSGIGGGGFVVYYDAASKALATYDGRETAPAAARPERFMAEGEPMAFGDAVRSGLSVGVPGLVRLLEHVHGKHGRLPWREVLAPAIRLAREGFEVSPRLHLLLTWFGPDHFAPAARAYFFTSNGSPWPVGYRLANPEFAKTLEQIAEHGAAAFYGGAVADAIVAAVGEGRGRSGDMTREDLAGYRVVERPAICTPYRGKRICGMGPPSSGAIAVGATLALIEPLDGIGGRAAAGSALALHLLAEAERLAYADRDRYIADPAFVTVPAGLLDAGYLAERRKLIDPARAMKPPAAGTPPGMAAPTRGADATVERGGTTHLSVIDAEGNAAAMTATIEGAFGSGLWASGFLLNNELTDFSFRAVDGQGRAIANRVEAGKRPRSSMAPTIVLDAAGGVEAVLGSPGGNRIPLYVVKALVALIDWGMDAAEAAALLNAGSRGGTFEIEIAGDAIWPALQMKALGHVVQPDLMTSGLHIVTRRNGILEGGADPRREGVAVGD